MLSRLTIGNYQGVSWFSGRTGAFGSAVRRASYFGSRDLRVWFSLGLISVSLASIVVYIIGVNSILLNGEAIKRQTASLKEIERNYLKAKSALAERESPAWLEEQSKMIGMIEAEDVRFVSNDRTGALSR